MARPKIYQINEDYFDSPLTERGAYFLGLIMSDGHLNYNRGRFEYSCSMKDLSLIEFIKNELKSTHPIRKTIINGTTYARYNVTNTKLVRSIIDKYSLPYSNKSENNIDIPIRLEESNIPHFLRGFFDGDGSIWVGGGTYRASYTGGEKMMKSIQLQMNKLCIPSYISYRYSKQNKNSCNLTINGTLNIEKLGRYLYKDATCFLNRKYKKFEECNLQAEYVKHRSLSLSGNEEKIKEMYLTGISQAEIARRTELIPSSVRCCVQRLRKNNSVV